MNDKIFFDTNVILYAYSVAIDHKNSVAKRLINNTNSIVSTQVLQEMCNVLIKKFKLDQVSILKTLSELNKNFSVKMNNGGTINEALKIHFKYQYSFYDSLIIASALENECSILYSEDLQHSQKVEDALTIINPFI